MIGGNRESRGFGILHIGITTSDVNRLLLLFREVFGCDVSQPLIHDAPVFEKVTGVPGAAIKIAFVDFHGTCLELLEYVEPRPEHILQLRPCDPGHVHLNIEVDDIEATLEQLQHFDFQAVGPVQYNSANGFKVIYVTGPDNLVFELMQFDEEPQ